MINLPKPSPFSRMGNLTDKIDYLYKYLSSLVGETEKQLALLNKQNKKSEVFVKDIRVNNSKLIIRYSDDSVKNLDIGG